MQPAEPAAWVSHVMENQIAELDVHNLAERTGLEPATSGVTGRHSNQLNYRSIYVYEWWAEQGLNL
jgi:hypothetical protein